MEVMIHGVTVQNFELLPESRIRECIARAEKEAGMPIVKITLTTTETGEIRVDYLTFQRKFERIRRITGYLVGTIDRWNNAKKSEERERVKHG